MISWNLVKKYFVEIAVFWCGFCVMVIEILGSRIFAPYFGTTVVVWTLLIGVVLASLSLGYVYGGKLADKNPSALQFSRILLLAALGIVFVWFWDKFILPKYTFIYQLGTLGMFLSAVFMFGPVSFVFAMVSPYAIKIKSLEEKFSATIAGRLYALSTVGSIAGTFIAGFILIPKFGINEILLGLFFVTVVLSLAARPIKELFKGVLFGLLIALSLFFAEKTFALRCRCIEINTLYNRYKVVNFPDWITGRQVVALQSDVSTFQGAVFTDNDNDLVFDYLKYYRLAEVFNTNIKKGLMIGGGVYAFPKDFVRRLPDSTIDVVDIDPEIISIAKEYFNYKDDIRINPIVADGRIYLNNNKNKYDVIYLDAFNSKVMPFQLTTVETVENIYRGLSDDGVVFVNILTAISGYKSRILATQVKNYERVFGKVYLYKVSSSPDNFAQNIILVASKNKDKKPISKDLELLGYLKNEIKPDYPNTVAITDNYAPTDYFVSI